MEEALKTSDDAGTARISILGIPISRMGIDQALTACLRRAAQRRGGFVCFANVHTVTESQWVPCLRDSLSSAFLSVADGVPLVWASHLKGYPIKSRVCGPDFMKRFLETNRALQYGFIGGSEGTPERLLTLFDLKAAFYSPPFRAFSESGALEDWNTFLDRCPNRKAPSVVWVGLGAPKQEMWMKTVSAAAPDVLFFGVGAAFDFLTGTKRRSPIWMQQLGLEWLFRLLSEPRRLWKRYLVTNTLFLAKITAELWSNRFSTRNR